MRFSSFFFYSFFFFLESSRSIRLKEAKNSSSFGSPPYLGNRRPVTIKLPRTSPLLFSNDCILKMRRALGRPAMARDCWPTSGEREGVDEAKERKTKKRTNVMLYSTGIRLVLMPENCHWSEWPFNLSFFSPFLIGKPQFREDVTAKIGKTTSRIDA